MTLEAVVSQDAPEVGVVGEEHAVHVPHLFPHTDPVSAAGPPPSSSVSKAAATHLPLVPVGGLVDRNGGVHGRQLVRVRLHTNTGVVAQRQQVVHDL